MPGYGGRRRTRGRKQANSNPCEVKDAVKTLDLVHNPQQWQAWKKTVIGRDIPDEKLSAGHLAKLKRAVDQAKRHQAA